ncbi:hypothetical protein RGUI_1749 [Rhodovulum sp. P5]|nr:hypothetical protein RGUI_1749 [Rhodovulum sp. P5]
MVERCGRRARVIDAVHARADGHAAPAPCMGRGSMKRGPDNGAPV